jgi:microcystin-dependent protein
MTDTSKIKVERIADGVQTGDLCYSLRTEKEGWLLCDGTSYSVSDYPNLFNVIGYTFGGSGDNFNVPNCSGKFLQMDTSKSIGQSIEAGLPNITGTFRGIGQNIANSDSYESGAFKAINEDKAFQGADGNDAKKWDFDASRSSSIYGNSDTVQPPAIIVNYFIKY